MCLPAPVAFCRHRTLLVALVVSCMAALLAGAAEPAKDPGAPPSPTAAVLIVENPPPLPGEIVPADSDAVLRRRVNTHVATLRGGVHINKAVSNANSDMRKTKWFAASEDPRERIGWLREKIKVRAIPDTALIEVSLEAVEDPAERAIILQELVNVYLEGQRQARNDALLERTQSLNVQRIKGEARMRDLEQEIQELQLRLNIDGGSAEGVGVKQIELKQLIEERVLHAREAFHLRNELERAVTDAQKSPPRDGPEILAILREDARLQRLRERLDDLVIRRAVAAKDAPEKGQDKQKDAGVAGVEAEVEATRKLLESATQEAAAAARAARIQELTARHEASHDLVEIIGKQAENMKNDLGELGNATLKFASKQDEQRLLRERLKEIKESIEQVMAAQGSASSVEIRWHTMPEK